METKQKRKYITLSNGMTVEEQLITPQMAALYLMRNRCNRKMSKVHVNYIRHIIESGEWSLIHQGISFDDKEDLIDGQHRLQAIASGVTAVPVLVFRQAPQEHRRKVDYGRSRTLRDIFTMEGLSHALQRSAIYRLICNFARGNYKNQGKISPSLGFELHEVLDEYVSRAIDTVLLGHGGIRRAAPVAVGAMLYMLNWDNREDVDEFLIRIKTGVNLKLEDPEMTWRTWYTKLDTGVIRTDMLTQEVLCFTFHAFSKRREGKELRKLFIKKQNEYLDDYAKDIREILTKHGVNLPPPDTGHINRTEATASSISEG